MRHIVRNKGGSSTAYINVREETSDPEISVLDDHYTSFLLVADAQRLNKRRLRHLYLTELTHPLLAFFLLIQKLAFTGHVTAVTFGRNILAQG